MLLSGLAMAIVALTSVSAEEPRCVKWRATSGCDGHGARDSWYDASCSATINHGSSGYCECENRRRVRQVGCDHHPFTCEEACKQDASAELNLPSGMEFVTCGSTIKLVHEESRFRLHSHEVNYGTGSGQQSVTAHGSQDDFNSYWLVKEGDSEIPCVLGMCCQDILSLISMQSTLTPEGTSTLTTFRRRFPAVDLLKSVVSALLAMVTEATLGCLNAKTPSSAKRATKIAKQPGFHPGHVTNSFDCVMLPQASIYAQTMPFNSTNPTALAARSSGNKK
ncbi:hypothetical protein AeRB84_012217 [Aphanomyces euteiches]|nr:hypothetical protein AeRB84_012217 [Aphanomyces euteiches]